MTVKIRCWQDIEQLTLELGFLPFFANEIDNFSIEEFTPNSLWFTEKEGPWDWKGPVAMNGKVVYGKFFNGKAGFISLKWFSDFCNVRRDGYDFDARIDEGLAYGKDIELYNLIVENKQITTKQLKSLGGYGKDGKKGFDSSITRLQYMTYINICNFIYPVDKNGNFYGWGIAQYTTPEIMFGYDKVTKAYKYDVEESRQRILRHLRKVLPQAKEKDLGKLL